MTARFIRLSLAFIMIIATSATIQPVKSKVKVKKNPHKVIFFDDFSGTSIDRSKWHVVVGAGPGNNEQQAYVDSTATIYIAHGAEAAGAHDGALVIKPVYSPGYVTAKGQKFDFISGRMDTEGKFMVTYGTLSARMKLPDGAGYWPAFWALGLGRWPDCGEIDIMEHYFGETPLVNKVFLKSSMDVTKWHVYAVDWNKDTLLFKIDGELFYRVTRPMIENYGR